MTSDARSEQKVCAVLLAAGLGRRFRVDAAADPHDRSRQQAHKLLADLRGRPVYRWAVDAVAGAGFAHVVVVTGAIELDLPDSVRGVHNPDFALGQASSLQCGVRTATELGADAIVVGLADQPFVPTAAWQTVAASPSPIAVATYAGRRANPVLLRRAIWSLLPSEGDQGARSLIGLRPELVSEVACTGSPADIDTMEDLQQWNSSTNSP